ncbi:MAG: hypoxanthine phosphoribosyltransferase [Desulfomonile tiedjei]|nr:hypoxanthine phosphoribosyltransferase [Desulfomonile tiedjei]
MTQVKKRILFDAETIGARVKELATEISTNHPDGNLLLIGLLKGSFVFLADLVRHLTVPCEIDFARVASYGTGTVSSGTLEIIMDVQTPIRGKDVILVDDIVDTGLTLSEYRKRIEQEDPRCLEVAALVDKAARRDKHVNLDYCGFQIDEGFLVGYGLDCNEQFRHLDSICVLE